MQLSEDNRKLLEVISKQERRIEELQRTAEEANVQKLDSFQLSQDFHQANKQQIEKLQDELHRLVDDNEALHKVMIEEQARFSRELSKMREEYDRQMAGMVPRSIKDGLEQTVKGLQHRLLILEVHIEDSNKMHQQELEHMKQIHELELTNYSEQAKKDINRQYEDWMRKQALSSNQDEQKLAHLERITKDQKLRISALEQTITDLQDIHRLRMNSKAKWTESPLCLFIVFLVL